MAFGEVTHQICGVGGIRDSQAEVPPKLDRSQLFLRHRATGFTNHRRHVSDGGAAFNAWLGATASADDGHYRRGFATALNTSVVCTSLAERNKIAAGSQSTFIAISHRFSSQNTKLSQSDLFVAGHHLTGYRTVKMRRRGVSMRRDG
jgi:hypothetical protein